MPDIEHSSADKAYDALIVGAGLAGSAAAIQLARAGKSVCIIEKTLKPHHKVCGEFLSHEAVSNLNELGLDVKSIGAVPVTQMRLIKGARVTQSSLPFLAYSVSRFALDEALLNLAASAGAVIQRGITITSILNDDVWQASGQDFTAQGHALFLATGKHDSKGWQRPDGVKNDYIGFKMHYCLDDEKYKIISDCTDVILFRGGYAGLQPIENGRVNLCLVIEKKRFKKFQSNWNSFSASLLRDTPYLNKVLEGAIPCWDKPLAIYGIPYGFVYKPERKAPKNLYRLGDQMAVIPSFAGGGMAIALYTAQRAVQYYLSKDAQKYNKDTVAGLKGHIRKSTCLDLIIATGAGQNFLIKLGSLFPALLKQAAHYTRLSS